MMRRAFILGTTLVLAACARKARCKRCGMVIDPASRWLVTMTLAGGATEAFDTPKCAFFVLRTEERAKGAKLRMKAYYGQNEVPDAELVFALGSDVLGPMGEDLVPIEPEHATKFQREHHAKSMLKTDAVTRAVVEGL